MLTKNRVNLIFIIIISLIPLFALFHSGFPITHDGQDHVARIANFYRNLEEGNIVPRWAGNLNWGYGHPILMFLYPLPSYLSSFFHFFGFSLVDSLKLTFGISYILSGFAMYLFIKSLLNDERAGIISGILYLFAPYRFVDMYVRGAIGEHVAFIFPPLILYLILKLRKEPSSWLYIAGGSLSIAGLVLSHNALTIMFLPLILLFVFYVVIYSKNKIKMTLSVLLILILGFGISAFFWIPAFFEGKYTLRDIVMTKDYFINFVEPYRFFSTNWSYGGTKELSAQVGMLQWIVVFFSLISAIYLYRTKNKMWVIIGGLLFIFFVTLFLMMQQSQFIWEKITVLQKFQFPWRFLSVIVILTSILGGLNFSLLPIKKKTLFLFFIIVVVLFINRSYWQAKGYLNNSDTFYSGVYNGTTDTGESAPIWSVRFMEKKPKAYIEVISGDAKIQELKRISSEHAYSIYVNSRTRIRENTLYFPGWDVMVDGKNLNIEFQDRENRGLITFFLEKGAHNVNVKFGETKMRLFADIITIISLVLMISYSFFNKLWLKFR